MVHSGGKVFSDGSIVELIRIPNGELSFLIWNGKSAKTAAQFVCRGETFAPLRVDPTILPWLQLPSRTKEFGSTRKLFGEISGLISRTHVDDGIVEGFELLCLRDLVGGLPPCSALPLDRRTAHDDGGVPPPAHSFALPPLFGLE